MGHAPRTPRRIVVRAVNLFSHAFRKGPRYYAFGQRHDREILELLDFADLVIFQSEYQRRVFTDAGYSGAANVVIHNGADPVFASTTSRVPLTGELRFASSSVAPRVMKQLHLVAELSRVRGVQVAHFGPWPAGLDPGRVQLMGTLQREALVVAMRECHYFFHPSIRDQCPNVVFEAVSLGLPVIYHPGPGSSREIVRECGFAMDEHDLSGTAKRARESLHALRDVVHEQRQYYQIGRAGLQYTQAFERVLSAEAASSRTARAF
jgi:glycosyltransferase involved in cell wall biosynthesis